MKKTLLFTTVISIFVTSLLISFPSSNLYSQNAEKAESQISAELLKGYIDFLASDSLKGRLTPSKELDMAADYIAAQFAKVRLKKINGSYFQTVPFYSQNLDVQNSHLKITGSQGEKEYIIKNDFIPFEMTADGTAIAEIVFAGYGITAPEYNYDDYEGVDVKGKIVLILKHEPGENDSTSVFSGKKETKYSLLKTKLANAIQHGAAGLLVVTDPGNHMMLKPQGFPWPALSKIANNDNLPISLNSRDGSEIPVVQIGDAIIKQLFGSVDSLRNIQNSIDKATKPNSFPLPGFNCELSTTLILKHYYPKNVAGYVKGADKKLAEELVIIGAHYDHIGFEKQHKEDEDYIYNGADDNASGTAGVMAIAKAFSSMKQRPERSILFILFAGEESGLCGSEFYCEHPLFPLDKTVAMLNLDMIARNGEDTLQVEGKKVNPDLSALIFKENEGIGLKNIPTEDELYAYSDNYNFYKKGISAISVTSGLHNDYHTVNDNPDRADFIKASKISRLIFRAVWAISNDNKYFTILKNK